MSSLANTHWRPPRSAVAALALLGLLSAPLRAARAAAPVGNPAHFVIAPGTAEWIQNRFWSGLGVTLGAIALGLLVRSLARARRRRVRAPEPAPVREAR